MALILKLIAVLLVLIGFFSLHTPGGQRIDKKILKTALSRTAPKIRVSMSRVPKQLSTHLTQQKNEKKKTTKVSEKFENRIARPPY